MSILRTYTTAVYASLCKIGFSAVEISQISSDILKNIAFPFADAHRVIDRFEDLIVDTNTMATKTRFPLMDPSVASAFLRQCEKFVVWTATPTLAEQSMLRLRVRVLAGKQFVELYPNTPLVDSLNALHGLSAAIALDFFQDMILQSSDSGWNPFHSHRDMPHYWSYGLTADQNAKKGLWWPSEMCFFDDALIPLFTQTLFVLVRHNSSVTPEFRSHVRSIIRNDVFLTRMLTFLTVCVAEAVALDLIELAEKR